MSTRPDGLDPAEQEVLRIRQFGLDPDPLDLTNDPAYVLGYAHGWDDAPLRRPTWRPPLDRLLVSCVLAVVLLVGIAVGRASAAPRSAQATDRFDVSPVASPELSGAPHVRRVLGMAQGDGPVETEPSILLTSTTGGTP